MDASEMDFWQRHSIEFLEMAFRTDKREVPSKPDGRGRKTGACGDTVEIFLVLDDDTIRSASFEADGCLNTVACANTVIHLVEGRTLDEAWEVMPGDVIRFLKTLPKSQHHCAELAVGALYLALADARESRKNPIKRIYGPR